jgi:hypothetical protein
MSRLALPVIVFLSLFLAPASASCAVYAFGNRSIEIPDPAGFAAASTVAPDYLAREQQAALPSHRLVEAYVTSEEFESPHQQDPPVWRRYGKVLVASANDGVPMGDAEFDALRARTRSDLEANAAPVLHIRILRDEPDGLLYVVSEDTISSGAGESPRRTSFNAGAAMVRVDGQLLLLGVVSDGDAREGGEGEAWVRSALTNWVDAIRNANKTP